MKLGQEVAYRGVHLLTVPLVLHSCHPLWRRDTGGDIFIKMGQEVAYRGIHLLTVPLVLHSCHPL
jgi:hypothetical protein